MTSTFNLLDIQAVLPELFLAVMALVLLMVGTFRGHRSTPSLMVGTVAVMVMALYFVATPMVERELAFNGMFLSDSFTRLTKVMILLASVFVLVIATPWVCTEQNQVFEFPILFLLSVTGLMLLVSANNLLSLYVALELASLSLYVLAAYKRDSVLSTEAGLKYFLLGALASGILLFGASLVYGFTGSASFDDIARVLTARSEADQLLNPGLALGMVMVIVGICFKISAVPFHMWTPDVYQGAPTPVTAFFGSAPKIAALILLTRFLLQPFGEYVEQWQQIIIVVSAITMAVGAFGAITQTNIKRLLAYSSIGHVGYALVGIAAANAAGIEGVMIYLWIYLFMNAGAFAVVLMMQHKGEYLESLSDFAGLSKTRPMLAASFALLMFSMAGIPPLAGFFAKLYVFLGAIEAGLYVLAALAVITSVVSAYYYIKLVKIMYFDEPTVTLDKQTNQSTGYVLAISVIFILGFCVIPTPFVDTAKAAVQALLP
jgi:NADH-quinone oxidoreductase subunit N